MAKKGSTKQPKKAVPEKPAATPAEPAAKPGFKAYALAIVFMVRDGAKKNILLTGGILLLLLSLSGVYVASRLSDNATLTNDELVVRVSRELKISGDANPAILTVQDEQKVSQPFLQEAKNGDKVLLYYKAGKSVLFRPSEDRIVRDGTFTPPDAKVFIRNGTTDDGKVAAVKQKLEPVQGVDITSQDNSTDRNQAKTVVVDLTDRFNDQAQKVAESLNASIVRLPKGETVPDADIMVIVGNN